MSAEAPTLAPGGSVAGASGGLAVRSLRSIRRLPSTFMPALLMPLFQTIAFSGTFYAITKIPGFPAPSSVNWYMPLAACMGSAFSGVNLGFSAVRDLESGFFDRLRMSPTPRWSMIVGPLVSAWIRTLIVVTAVLLLGLVLGASLPGGLIAIVVLYIAALGVATVGAGWGLGLAYRFRDMRAAAIMQLTLFLTLFLSTAQAPLNIIEGWLHTVARYNPMTYVLTMARSGFVGEVTWDDVWPGVTWLVVFGLLATVFARRSLVRLERA